MNVGYIYFLIEEGSTEFADCVKIGTALDPLNRPKGYKAGNPRKLKIVFTLAGGQPLESEFHREFALDRVGSGGDEWYKVTPKLLDFAREKLEQQLTVSSRETVTNDIEEPIKIPFVKLGEAAQPRIRSTAHASTVQTHKVSEADSPKNPYAKVYGWRDDT